MRGALRALCAFALLSFCAAGFAFQKVGEIKAAALPPEARATIALIRKGGPFPYAKDAGAFGNREGILPRRERGYYREYTVKTPGVRERGARRMVAGRAGELYYSDDHYRSFRRVLE
ncbi:MAG: ribonuclease domain-containing protein [Burkholderiales bacterium]